MRIHLTDRAKRVLRSADNRKRIMDALGKSGNTITVSCGGETYKVISSGAFSQRPSGTSDAVMSD